MQGTRSRVAASTTARGRWSSVRLSDTNTLTGSVRSQRLGLKTVTEASESPDRPKACERRWTPDLTRAWDLSRASRANPAFVSHWRAPDSLFSRPSIQGFAAPQVCSSKSAMLSYASSISSRGSAPSGEGICNGVQGLGSPYIRLGTTIEAEVARPRPYAVDPPVGPV